MSITSRRDSGVYGCFIGRYFEIRDGLNQSANLLSMLCETSLKGYVFRSSGQNMWLKFHRQRWEEIYFYINYTAKPVNVTGLFTHPFFFFYKTVLLLPIDNRRIKNYVHEICLI